MPDRFDGPLKTLDAELRELVQETKDLRRQNRRGRVYSRALAVVVIAVALLAGWNYHERNVNDHDRCVSTNESRLAIREADKSRGDNLVSTVHDFTQPGDPLRVRVEADNARIIAKLAKALPTSDC